MSNTVIRKSNEGEADGRPEELPAWDHFYKSPDRNLPYALIPTGTPTDPSACSLSIIDGDSNPYCKGLWLEYDQTTSTDIMVLIFVPDGWVVEQGDGGTPWYPVVMGEQTLGYFTQLPQDQINQVVNSGQKWLNPFTFTNPSTGQRLDPAIRVTRPPPEGEDHKR